MTHSPTPWRVDEYGDIRDSEGALVLYNLIDLIKIREENLEHIVKCVNAYDGVAADIKARLGLIAGILRNNQGHADRWGRAKTLLLQILADLEAGGVTDETATELRAVVRETGGKS